MHRKARLLSLLLSSLTLVSCAYNPFIADNKTTGSPIGAAVGAGIGAGGVALLGGSRPYIGAAGLIGGAIGYYVTTLRYDSGGVIQAGGQVYRLGDFVGIYIPSDYLFEPNTADFIPQAKPVLDSVVAIIARYPNKNILVSGNTSGFYRARWELEISTERAQKVSAYLWGAQIKNVNIPNNRMKYVGHGDYLPIASDITNKGIRQNSRVQITLYPVTCNIFANRTCS